MEVLVFKDIKNNRWTLWNKTKTKHLGYKKTLVLRNCIFFVDSKKSKLIKKTKKRFPHAWIIGEITTQKASLTKPVSYNPFKDNSFKQGNNKISTKKLVLFDKTGKVFV